MSVQIRHVSLCVLTGFTMLVAAPLASPSGKSPGIVAATSRKAAPTLSLPDAGGKKHQLSDYKGRVVLLDFWATWCTGCKLEIPWFMEYQKKYKHSGFTVVGVAMDEEGWKLVRPYVKEKKINYPIVVDNSQSEAQLRAGLHAMRLLSAPEQHQSNQARTAVGRNLVELEPLSPALHAPR